MPMLRFRCSGCGFVFEDLVSVSGIGSVRCPHCGEKTERLYEGKCYGATKMENGGVCPGTGKSCACAGNCPHH